MKVPLARPFLVILSFNPAGTVLTGSLSLRLTEPDSESA